MFSKVNTEQIGNMWTAEIQFQLFQGDPAATWVYGPKGQGATPEEAIRDATSKTAMALCQANDRLGVSTLS